MCLLAGRLLGGPTAEIGIGRAALVFVPIWFVVAAFNLWRGVTKAGYSVADEVPVFLVVFVIPATIAVWVWWKIAHR